MKWINTILSLFLALLVSVNVLSFSLLRAHYEMNLSYYEEELCENKNKPELACHGQCAFMKKINAMKDHTNQHAISVQISMEYLIPSLTKENDKLERQSNTNYLDERQINYSQPFLDILRPPKV